MQTSHVSDRILRPVRGWFLTATLLLALLLNMVPLSGLPGIPDFVALVLTFWCIREPLKIGMGAAFLLGLTMDIADASIIGQHTLAYVLLAYAANSLSRRILWFRLIQQALQILPLLLLAQTIMLVTRLTTGAPFPGLTYFLGSFIATLLWYPMTYLLLLPQYQPEEKDENRPI
jgi:rod shape-determining protein MreD